MASLLFIEEPLSIEQEEVPSHASSPYQIYKIFSIRVASDFQRMTSQVVETLVLLCVCHLFELYNPNQVADALALPKAGIYRPLNALSLYHSKALNLRLGCAMETVDFIKDAESKSPSTHSRRRSTVSVDDSNLPRETGTLAHCSKGWSKKHNTSILCQNVLGITLKVGDRVLPLDIRLVSKQGRGNTDKPSLVIAMFKDVLAFFDAHAIDLRKYPMRNFRIIKNTYTCVKINGGAINPSVV